MKGHTRMEVETEVWNARWPQLTSVAELHGRRKGEGARQDTGIRVGPSTHGEEGEGSPSDSIRVRLVQTVQSLMVSRSAG